MNKIFPIFIIFTFSLITTAQEKKKVDIRNADYTYINNEKHPDYWRLIGNVNIFHNETNMFCDSAYYFSENEKIIAFNNIKITKDDDLNLYGDKLNYDGENNLAVISSNVLFKNNKSQLTTNELKFNLKENIIYYETKSRIIKENQDIRSNVGSYNLDEEKYEFRDSVIFSSDKYLLKTNKLISYENKNNSKLIGPSYIYFDDKTIFCNEGYITKNSAEFFNNASITTNDIKIASDSIYYDEIKKSILTLGNVVLTDTINNLLISSNEAIFLEVEEKMTFKKEPCLKLMSNDDTLTVYSKIFESYSNKGETTIHAKSNVEFFNTDLIGKCDSLYYSSYDSSITLYDEPIIWIDEYQIFSDTISINYFDKKINKLILISNPLIISKNDSLEYNQIKGKKMIGSFKDNKLKNIQVLGNGQSIYYLNENDKTIGLNYLESSNITLVFKDKKINNINYEIIPHSKTSPINEIKKNDRYLKGFKWKIDEKPKIK